jgi:hypothetical protein
MLNLLEFQEVQEIIDLPGAVKELTYSDEEEGLSIYCINYTETIHTTITSVVHQSNRKTFTGNAISNCYL